MALLLSIRFSSSNLNVKEIASYTKQLKNLSLYNNENQLDILKYFLFILLFQFTLSVSLV